MCVCVCVCVSLLGVAWPYNCSKTEGMNVCLCVCVCENLYELMVQKTHHHHVATTTSPPPHKYNYDYHIQVLRMLDAYGLCLFCCVSAL